MTARIPSRDNNPQADNVVGHPRIPTEGRSPQWLLLHW
jgi:hypothetical protein